MIDTPYTGPGEFLTTSSAGGTAAAKGTIFFEIEELPFQDVGFIRPNGPLTTPDEVIAFVQLAFATGNYADAKNTLEEYNNLEGDIDSTKAAPLARRSRHCK